MPRNLNRRIEVAFPVLEPALKKRIVEDILPIEFSDNSFAWTLGADGEYAPCTPGDESAMRAQATFMRMTRNRAQTVRKSVRPELNRDAERFSPAVRAAEAQQRRQRQESN
jgi:polyphosphate kinase